MKLYTLIAKEFTGIYFDEIEMEKASKYNASNVDVKTFNDIDSAYRYIVSGINFTFSKLYAVKNGRVKGIFFKWGDCKQVVDGYPAAVYKSFQNIKAAVLYLHPDFSFNSGHSEEPIISGDGGDLETINNSDSVNEKSHTASDKVAVGNRGDKPFAYVDGSFNAATRVYGYGVILIANGTEYTFSGANNVREMVSMRNVSGEIEGAMRAITEAIKLGLPEITIYYDYMGIQMWAEGSWKRNKTGTVAYYDFIQEAKKKIKIKFVKVKAHSNILLNEKVDALAKAAVGNK